MPPKQQQVYMLVDPNKFDADGVVGVYGSKKSAGAALSAEGAGLEIQSMDVKEFVATETKGSKTKATANTKAKATKKTKEAEPDEDDDHEDEAADQDEAPPAKKAANKQQTKPKDDSRKHIPEGKPGALEGVKLLFTGTFDAMDRDTSKATAVKYGAKVITKLEDTDYIVLGVKAGQKKLDEIEAKGLETVDEAGFYELLQNGIPDEKRERMEAKAEAEPAKKKQKK